MTYLVVDIETSVDNDLIGDDRASPFYVGNKAVLIGWKEDHCGHSSMFVDTPTEHFNLCDITILVGQNIRFDMHYLYKLLGQEFEKWLYNPEHAIWDTQLAEYILTAQQHKYASLDELAAKYGGTLKDSRIKDYWDNGVRTEDIPKEELAEYLKHDVLNTELVYLAQKQLAEETGMLPLIETQMKCLVATWEMAKNGMRFNIWKALDGADALGKEIELLEQQLLPYMQQAHPHLEDISVSSNDCLSRLLFGGEYKYSVQEPMLDENGSQVVFKSGVNKGRAKTKRVEKIGKTKGLVKPNKEWATAKAGFYQVGEHVMQALLDSSKTPDAAREVIELVTKLRAAVKDRETYFVGFSKLAWPQEENGLTAYYIHGKLNHVSTDTGRLSSSSPNLQNLSNKDREAN